MAEINESSVYAMAVGMEEEGRNQRMKVEEEVQDRISLLPDCILVEIFSRLPSTRSAIRTGTLSKRWMNLWTWVPTLTFTHIYDPLPPSDFVSFVDKILTQCPRLKRRKFEVYTGYDTLFETQVNNWIRYAISCNVEELKLMFFDDARPKFPLNQYFFANSSFTHLRLHHCEFNPTGMISWRRLRSLWISLGNLDEQLIQNILSGSPQLDTIVLQSCKGYRRLDITSKSVKKLVVCGYTDDDNAEIIEVNAPYVLSLKILGKLGVSKPVLLNLSSLVEAFLDYMKLPTEHEHSLEAEEETLKGFIQSLHHVKVLNIGRVCSKVIKRLEAKGFSAPSNMKLVNVTSPLR